MQRRKTVAEGIGRAVYRGHGGWPSGPSSGQWRAAGGQRAGSGDGAPWSPWSPGALWEPWNAGGAWRRRGRPNANNSCLESTALKKRQATDYNYCYCRCLVLYNVYGRAGQGREERQWRPGAGRAGKARQASQVPLQPANNRPEGRTWPGVCRAPATVATGGGRSRDRGGGSITDLAGS